MEESKETVQILFEVSIFDGITGNRESIGIFSTEKRANAAMEMAIEELKEHLSKYFDEPKCSGSILKHCLDWKKEYYGEKKYFGNGEIICVK